jgi:hypothetical protein
MFTAAELQALLIGGGSAVGVSMAGIGAYKFFSAGAHQIRRIPASLERGAEAMERGVKAIENQSAILTQVLELKDLTIKMLGQIAEVRNEREEIGRELRIMSRRIESTYGDEAKTES